MLYLYSMSRFTEEWELSYIQFGLGGGFDVNDDLGCCFS